MEVCVLSIISRYVRARFKRFNKWFNNWFNTLSTKRTVAIIIIIVINYTYVPERKQIDGVGGG